MEFSENDHGHYCGQSSNLKPYRLHNTTRMDFTEINAMTREQFVQVIGPAFELSPWIAERTWMKRPFHDREHLHRELCETLRQASEPEKVALIQAHPDLVGRAVLTAESKSEQAAASLDDLSFEEIALFDKYNRDYRARFGFPFVICARLNKKDAILNAFPKRLNNSREQEVETALAEIEKIAELRLADLVQ
jgi:2-oxo-4-hydroxy-4-carboxy-5-ureidoimidazoline decarboxylase